VSTISGFPTGLLGLLDSKNFGQQPNTLSDVIVPIVDTTGLFETTKQFGEVQLIAAPANGINVGLRVPQGEVWRVHAGGVFCLTGAGDSLEWTPVIEVNLTVIPIADTQVQGSDITRMVAMKVAPFWLQPGSQLSVFISAIVGVPTAMSVAYLVSRLRV